jgi:hypothetical protein
VLLVLKFVVVVEGREEEGENRRDERGSTLRWEASGIIKKPWRQ